LTGLGDGFAALLRAGVFFAPGDVLLGAAFLIAVFFGAGARFAAAFFAAFFAAADFFAAGLLRADDLVERFFVLAIFSPYRLHIRCGNSHRILRAAD
jgi:hypothetical protein